LNDDRDDAAIDTLSSNLGVRKVGVVERDRLYMWAYLRARSR